MFRSARNNLPDRSKVRVPIRLKITLPFLALAVVLALGVSYLVTRIVFDTVEERFLNQLIEAGRLSSEWMVRSEERMLASLRLIGRTEGVAETLENNNPERLREIALSIAVNNGEKLVLFIDQAGVLTLAISHNGGTSPVDYSFVTEGYLDLEDWEAVALVLANEEDLIGDKFADLASFNGSSQFYIAGPIYHPDGSFAGVAAIGTPLNGLVSELQLETRIQSTLYDFSGQTIATTFSEEPSLPVERVGEVLENQSDSSLRHNLDFQRDITVGNIDYEEILGPWEARDGVDLGVIGSALPKTFLVRASSVTRLQIFGLVAVTLAMVILFGLYIARLITNPLQGLVDASSQVADGQLDVQLDIRSQDEIELLSNSFNSMVSNLYRTQSDLVHAHDSALAGWAKALELRDQITEGHTQRVVDLTIRLAREFGYEGEALEHIRRGALLHDIGKVGIPDSILQKPGKLTDAEWEIMRKHPVYSYELIKEIEFLLPAIDIPLYHHEKWNGTGYPKGLKGTEIPLPARIFAVIDVWDALTNDRPYRKAWSSEKAIAYLLEKREIEFDPDVVNRFVRFVAPEQVPETGL